MPPEHTINLSSIAFQPTTASQHQQYHVTSTDPTLSTTSSSAYRNNNTSTSTNNILYARASTAASLIGSAPQANNYNAQLTAALAAATTGTSLV